MAFNKEDLIRVKEEFSRKYIKAREAAETRRAEVHAKIPEVFEIDRILSKTGLEIMGAISSGNTQQKISELEQRNNQLIAERGALLLAAGYPADYTDVHYECEKCGDTGYVETTMCECMKHALIKAGYESSGLGSLIGKQTFENFKSDYYGAERQRTEKMVEMLKSFAQNFDKDTYANFLLTGTSGLGKTHLSTAVAQKVIERGFDVLYVSAVGMLGDFEERRFGNNAGMGVSKINHVSRYYDADLLIIDDLGTEVVNKFTQAYFYEVINTRINTRKCTIINTNLLPTDIMDTYSERIASRMLGEYQPLLFKGTDIRKQKILMGK